MNRHRKVDTLSSSCCSVRCLLVISRDKSRFLKRLTSWDLFSRLFDNLNRKNTGINDITIQLKDENQNIEN